MNKLIAFTTFVVCIFNLAFAQKAMVTIGNNGRLNYTKYANTGEDTLINQIPDFSYSGYKKGGIKIPELPVVKTIKPLDGDNRENIQMTINEVEKLPLNIDGFRGVILLEAGIYNCSGPIEIKASGIVLRGQGQNTASEGGTQLHATASTQHNLIKLKGTEVITTNLSYVDTLFVPQASEQADGNFWLQADVKAAVNAEQSGNGQLSLHLVANNGQYSTYHSKEGANPPYLEIVFMPEGSNKDSIILLPPTDDTYVRGDTYSIDNYGTEDELVVKSNGENSSFTRESFLKFDVSNIKGEIKSAILNLWCANAGNDSDQQHFIIHVENDDWSESTLTYSNRVVSSVMRSVQITDSIVAVGANSFNIEDASSFNVGDKIAVKRTPNQYWIDELDMAQYGWTPQAYHTEYERIITAINNNKLSIDAPIVQAIDVKYGGAVVYHKNVTDRLENCGIENMLISSTYTNNNDEDHGWTAISLSKTENCWVKKVSAKNFGYSCVTLDHAYQTTVEDCAMLDPISQTTGGRKYSFNINNGSFNLFQRCYTRGGRHDFVCGSKVAGPNVFLDCVAEQTHSDIGPHHRYATGTLFDNIHGGQIRVQNRKDSGTGHGWAGAQTMFWNLKGSSIKVESPKGAMNWGIGCKADSKSGEGYWENWGQNITPRSLYLHQLQDRLGLDAIKNIATQEQLDGTIIEKIKTWGGLDSLKTYNSLESLSFENIKMYPNPCTNVLYLNTINSAFSDIQIFDNNGKKQNIEIRANSKTITIATSELESGLYLVKISSSTGQFSTLRFIKL